MADRPLSGQQLEVLQYVSENSPVTVRDVAEKYGEPRGLARTTILTVMERLRKRGYLTRSMEDGHYRYSPLGGKRELLVGMVRDFVETALGGSLGPVVAYLARARNLTDTELEELQQLAEELRQKREDGA
jgi:predicted transcriptional regulator